jgi:SpoU rRNA methylase family enzyme
VKWQKGSSGNPRGRPLGTNEIGKLRAGLAKHVPAIIEAMVEAAKGGDTAAAKLILKRAVPALRTEELPVTLEGFAGNRVEMIAAVVQAIADGKLDMSRGGRLIAVLAPEALEERIAKFELMIEEQNK